MTVKETLIKWLYERTFSLRNACNFAYLLNGSRLLRSECHALHLAQSFLILALSLGMASAGADTMFRCVDANGHTSFSNINLNAKGKTCTPMALDPIHPRTAPARSPAARTPTPPNFPRVGQNEQRARDSDRRAILGSELENERRRLAQAKEALSKQETARTGDEQAVDRLAPYRNAVSRHQRNIESIELELSRTQ